MASVEWKRDAAAEARVSQLADGDRVRFGCCRCDACPVDVRLNLFAIYGEVRVRDRVVWVTNGSPRASIVLCDLEDRHQQIELVAGRPPAPVPFELCELMVAGADRPFATLFGPEPELSTEERIPVCRTPVEVPRLDPGARYFAVLQVLCAASLAPGGNLPTSAEIADRLRERGIAITTRAVDHHVEYLIQRFGLDNPSLSVVGRNGRREGLATAALHLGIVDP